MLLKNNNAKFAFLYLFSLVALLFMALGTGQAIFHAIIKYIPDPTLPYSGDGFMMLTAAIAMLIISIPLYFIAQWIIEKSLRNKDADHESAIRRWLTYFILFVTSVVMIVWFIVTITNYLDGELTTRFAFKALTAVVIAAIIFSYYLYDIRRDKIEKKNLVVRIYGIAALVITIGSLVLGFIIADSPAVARARKQDEQILNQYSELDSVINQYYTKYNKMPTLLDEALAEAPYLEVKNYKNPVTQKAYEYKKLADDSYQLCTDFQSSNKNADNRGSYSDRWPHDSGYQCLKQKTIDYNDQGSAKPISSPIR